MSFVTLIIKKNKSKSIFVNKIGYVMKTIIQSKTPKMNKSNDMAKMKAIIYSEYGGPDVLKLAKVAKPYSKENEVLIKIHAVSVNFGDMIARNFKNVSPQNLICHFYFG